MTPSEILDWMSNMIHLEYEREAKIIERKYFPEGLKDYSMYAPLWRREEYVKNFNAFHAAINQLILWQEEKHGYSIMNYYV